MLALVEGGELLFDALLLHKLLPVQLRLVQAPHLCLHIITNRSATFLYRSVPVLGLDPDQNDAILTGFVSTPLSLALESPSLFEGLLDQLMSYLRNFPFRTS